MRKHTKVLIAVMAIIGVAAILMSAGMQTTLATPMEISIDQSASVNACDYTYAPKNKFSDFPSKLTEKPIGTVIKSGKAQWRQKHQVLGVKANKLGQCIVRLRNLATGKVVKVPFGQNLKMRRGVVVRHKFTPIKFNRASNSVVFHVYDGALRTCRGTGKLLFVSNASAPKECAGESIGLDVPEGEFRQVQLGNSRNTDSEFTIIHNEAFCTEGNVSNPDACKADLNGVEVALGGVVQFLQEDAEEQQLVHAVMSGFKYVAATATTEPLQAVPAAWPTLVSNNAGNSRNAEPTYDGPTLTPTETPPPTNTPEPATETPMPGEPTSTPEPESTGIPVAIISLMPAEECALVPGTVIDSRICDALALVPAEDVLRLYEGQTYDPYETCNELGTVCYPMNPPVFTEVNGETIVDGQVWNVGYVSTHYFTELDTDIWVPQAFNVMVGKGSDENGNYIDLAIFKLRVPM
jgi:Fe-S cluster biosynthesis and repair protein YggX